MRNVAAFIRLGKESVADIQRIDRGDLSAFQGSPLRIRCKQVPEQAKPDMIAFVVLGSDNNKGQGTEWNKGLRAIGQILRKGGGPNFNDEWTVEVDIVHILPRSLSPRDLLDASPDTFREFADLPVMGMGSFANQTVQVTGELESGALSALAELLGRLDSGSKSHLQSIREARVRRPAQPGDSNHASRVSREHNLIFAGVPGTGKTYLACQAARDFSDVIVIAMHPALSYEDFIEGVRPSAGADADGTGLDPLNPEREFFERYGSLGQPPDAPFCVRAGRFLLACSRACRAPDKRFLVILDEINRCNVPRVLGDLLLVLEPTKRARWDASQARWIPSVAATLPYSGVRLYVPENLTVVATMNSSDRSVSSLDQAVLRRFKVIRVDPLTATQIEAAIEPNQRVKQAIGAWGTLNARLEARFGPEAMLGHSYFFELPRDPGEEVVRSLWLESLIPQLRANGRLQGHLADLLSSEAALGEYFAGIGLSFSELNGSLAVSLDGLPAAAPRESDDSAATGS